MQVNSIYGYVLLYTTAEINFVPDRYRLKLKTIEKEKFKPLVWGGMTARKTVYIEVFVASYPETKPCKQQQVNKQVPR